MLSTGKLGQSASLDGIEQRYGYPYNLAVPSICEQCSA